MLSDPLFSSRLAVSQKASTGMNVTLQQSSERRLRLLVAIASFGEKNLEFLKRIICNYQDMPMDVDVVVFSDAPKDLGDGVKVVVVVESLWPFFRRWPKNAGTEVKVVVGLPTARLWSLPFAHKDLFAQNLDKYDLFAYSEDDVLVTEANIHAFLRATPQLSPDEIAGFLRYEVDKSGNRSLPEFHGPFHWKPDSIAGRGDYTVAEFTNEHAAFYLLTQDQLRKAIASGGFLRKPYDGRHDVLCTAATDPYLCCGFRKVICISALDDFLIHHLPNRYADKFGLSLEAVRDQVQTLDRIYRRVHPASALCETESRMPRRKWSKDYYEPPNEAFLKMVPGNAKNILSIGCGSGASETELQKRGAQITAVPLDSIAGAAAERRGIAVVYGTLGECLQSLDGRNFDCVLILDLLHLQPEPGRVLEQFSQLIRAGGTLVVCGPNFDRVPTFVRRTLRMNDYRKLRSFEQSGISVCGPKTLAPYIESAGLRTTAVRWLDDAASRGGSGKSNMWFGRLMAREWILQARSIIAN